MKQIRFLISLIGSILFGRRASTGGISYHGQELKMKEENEKK